MHDRSIRSNSGEEWELRQPYGWRTVAFLLLACVTFAYSGNRMEIDRGLRMIGEGVLYAVGLREHAEIAIGGSNLLASALPITISEKTEVARLPDFDSERLPPLAYLVQESSRSFDAASGSWIESSDVEYLVEPIGYLSHVLIKMIETIEMAFWGTVLALVLSIPLTYFAAREYSWNSLTYYLARAACSFCRALPEWILAIFFVLMFGFGTLPGIIALGIHCCGFLGKFFADDIENCDQGPQDALRCTGANRVQVLAYAVLPQTMPQVLAYSQYILERNVRTATVLGMVGAGGIGSELKGRLDLSDYSHVATILLVIFITVFLLEQSTQFVRTKLMRPMESDAVKKP